MASVVICLTFARSIKAILNILNGIEDEEKLGCQKIAFFG